MKIKIPVALCATYALISCSQTNREGQLPNIVLILADDLGYGDLSCYGQKNFSTPNIDRIAARGMLFTQHYSGCTVSAPSRSSLMTGLHTGHTPIRGNKGWEPEGNWPLPANTFSLGKMLQSKGYTTGAFGKWGLGYIESEGDPNLQGINTNTETGNNSEPQLYNLKTDLGERSNVAVQNPLIVKELTDLLQKVKNERRTRY